MKTNFPYVSTTFSICNQVICGWDHSVIYLRGAMFALIKFY